MPGGKRQGNRPDRRIAPKGFIDDTTANQLLAKMRYVGSGIHKLHPGDYGFIPPQNPRPSKTPCDDLRTVLLTEAQALFQKGVLLCMISQFPSGGLPKYVWAVDDDGEVYEAKTKPGQEADYHGYRVGDDELAMRKYVTKEWKSRCQVI